jgi:hypothetical protein
LLFRVLVVAPDHEPTFFPKTDPLKGELEARIKPRSTGDIPPNNIIRGRVVDREGVPQEKAVVSVDMVQQGNIGHGSPPVGTDPLAITDEQGNFAIYSKQAFDSMDLKVEARAMAPKRFVRVRGGEPVNDLMVTEGASLKGRVLLDGKPLKDVSIGAVSVDRGMENFSGDFEYATKEDGTFVFPNLPPNRDYFVYGMLKSFASVGALPARRIHVWKDGKVVDAGDLEVVPGHRLAGKMTLSDKKPLPGGTRLVIGRRDAWDSFAVDLPPTGEFDLSNLPAESLTIGGSVEGYRFSGQNVSMDRLNPFGLAGILDKDKTNLVVLLEPGERLPGEWDPIPEEERPENQPLSGIENGPKRAGWVLTGRIIDAESKAPIENARVTAGRAPGGRTNWMYWETTRFALSSNGVYRLELPKGKDPKMLRVVAEDHLPTLSSLLNFSEGDTVIDFELKKGKGPSGILLSAKGEPVPGVTVYLLGPGEQGGLSNEGRLMVHNAGDECKAITDAEGKFKFPARIGETELFAANDEGFLWAKTSDVQEGKKLQLHPWSKVRGVLVREGKPVSRQHLDLRWVKDFNPSRPYLNLHGTVTDDSGRFQIDKVPPEELAIALRKTVGEGNGGWQSINLKSFTAPAGEELDLGELTKIDPPQAAR